jgi:hypothetical protein
MTNLALGNSLSTQFRRASWAAVPAVRIEAALSEDIAVTCSMMPEAFKAIRQLSQQRTQLVAVSCMSGPRHHRNAPTLLHQRNLLCHEQDTSFSRFRSLLLGSVGQCARQAPHAPPGCFQGARAAPESLVVGTRQIPSTLPALRATIPVWVREACL